ncbi:MAG: hypothetical protein JXE06_00510 [Coriobacteriia bacterium]|nr:hypothetical protein [Coriobacteriia bacterium]MBN2823370.1 hypothetical protein [Coriobacteriia bacterium]
MSQFVERVIGYVRREWWLVVITTVAAVAVGIALVGRTPDVYRAEAVVHVDVKTIAKATGLPSPEQMSTATGSQEFINAVMDAVGTSRSELRDIRTYTVGATVESLVVSVDAESEDLARRTAQKGAEMVVEAASEFAASDVASLEEKIALTEATIAVSEAEGETTTWEDADIAYKRWELQSRLSEFQVLYSSYDDAYVYEDGVDIQSVSALASQSQTAAGAGFLGLFVGVVLGLVREWWLSRSGD